MADGHLDPETFDTWLAEQRPRLHRYCARMVGSAFEGEDVVQEALIKAVEAYPGAGALDRPDRWLLRIAHNTALDLLRRRKRRITVQSEAAPERAPDPGAAGDARVAAEASLATLMLLPIAQRAAVVLVDVLGHSAEEAVETLGVSLAALKASLHRGRARLRTAARSEPILILDPEEKRRLRDYADRFNARDFDALRALLAEEVRLDLAGRLRLDGRKDVSVYFTRYGESRDWSFTVGVAEGRLVLSARDPAGIAAPYVVLLDWDGERITDIRDFRYARYVADSLEIAPL
jgi:RNA polymerase sigma-70 factor (ECF subfamily)